jgi:hypothetical protein
MSISYLALKAEADSAEVLTATTESKNLPPILIQKGSPDEIIVSSDYIPQSRNSKLVGFERGATPLQPFLGPKEF